MDIKRFDALSGKDLRAVTILADVRNFRRAAGLCGVSQPALSTAIKKVEAALGVQLFERTSRSFQITRDGHEVVQAVREALAQLGGISSASGPRATLEGPFHLGFISTIGPYLVPKLIRPLLSKFSALELSFSEATTDVLVEKLLQRDLDAAIVALPIGHPRLVEHPLFQEELLLAVPNGHRLAKRASIDIHQVRQDELLLMEQRHCLRKDILENCGSAYQDARTVQAATLETLLCMVQAGVGVTLVPRMVLDAGARYRNVTFVKFKKPAPTRTVGLVTLQGNAVDSDIEAFAGVVRSAIG